MTIYERAVAVGGKLTVGSTTRQRFDSSKGIMCVPVSGNCWLAIAAPDGRCCTFNTLEQAAEWLRLVTEDFQNP